MTSATVWKSNNLETVRRIMVKGHSGYADLGFDIVCSSISTAMILTANLIEKLAKAETYNIILNDKQTLIDIEIKEFDNDDVLKKIMINLLETLESISSDYPKFFKIDYKTI